MIQLILMALVIFLLAANVLLSAIRGVAKSRIRGITVLSSAVLAVLATVVVRGALASESFLDKVLIPALESMNETEILEILGLSGTLNQVAINTALSFILPMTCLLLFIVFSMISWLVYFIVTLAMRKRLRRATKKTPHRHIRAVIWGLVRGLVVCFLILSPISIYGQTIPSVVDKAAEIDLLDGEAEFLVDLSETIIEPLGDSPVISVYHVIGGKVFDSILVDYNVNGSRVKLVDDLGHIVDFVCGVHKLSEKEMKSYGAAEATVFSGIAYSFDHSVLLPSIAGDIVYKATSAWMSDTAFLGVERPDLGEQGAIFDPLFDKFLKILNSDSQKISSLRADFHTFTDILGILARNGVFTSVSDTELLLSTMGNGMFDNIINTLSANPTMRALVPEFTGMGVRVLATAVGLPADSEAIFGEFADDIPLDNESIQKEAEALSSILNAATSILGQTSSGELDINAVASSVGNILDSLSETESFGPEKTDALFTAVLQSEVVREAIDMDMETATQMAEKATQKDENGKANYGQTFQAISNSVEVLSKFGTDGEEVTLEDIESMISNINPNLAGMVEVYFSEDRLVSFGFPEQYADTSAALVSGVFHYMADSTMDESSYNKEAKALNQILSVALSAGSGDSMLSSPEEAIDIFMESNAISYALRTALLDENGEVREEKFDAFGLGEEIQPGSNAYNQFQNILTDYYETHHDENTKLTLKAVSALLGVSLNLD